MHFGASNPTPTTFSNSPYDETGRMVTAVTGDFIHPIVGKLVEAAGDALAAGVRRRLDGE